MKRRFGAGFPSTRTNVAQRTMDMAKARSLLAAAGHGSGFNTPLITENFVEIPQYAQIVAQSAKEIGVNIGLKVESSSAYYGKATFGNSDWLDAPISLVDYGHRSGLWTDAQLQHSQYEKLVAPYIAGPDLSTQ